MNNSKRKYSWDSRSTNKATRKATGERIGRLIAYLILFLVGMFASIGLYALLSGKISPFEETGKTLSSSLGRPDVPHIYNTPSDLSNMDETLRGIERQLERMNDIHLKIYQEEGR
jgi:hypothetical protein